MKREQKKILGKAKKVRIVFRMGERIYIRPILREDLPFLSVSMNDQEITQYLLVTKPMSPEDEVKWFEGLTDRKETDIIFAIVLRDSDEIIGTMGLHKINHLNSTAETGSFIGRKDLWDKGYGTEAKMLVLEYGFNTLNLRKICSSVFDFNLRSKACLEKCGYHEEGCREKQVYRNGRFADEILMAVFKEDFLPKLVKYKKKFFSR